MASVKDGWIYFFKGLIKTSLNLYLNDFLPFYLNVKGIMDYVSSDVVGSQTRKNDKTNSMTK